MFSVKIFALPSAIERLRARGPLILEALIAKMDELMIRLQSKVIGESIPAFFPKGAPNIASTVQFVRAHVEGTKIVGAVTAGGQRTTKITLKSGAEVDYAAVQEMGVPTGWEILPFNKKALAFELDGKRRIFRRVFHPPLEARPFMRSELQNMESQIVTELGETFTDTFNA